jgi:release factor glutamine methyltransferase
MAEYEALVARRVAGEPVAYLTGVREWGGVVLAVSPAVLVPRPETELLLERASALLTEDASLTHVLDVGTGSGALAVVLAQRHPQVAVQAVDLSTEALAVAQRNAERLGVAVDFRQSDLLEHADEAELVVANLPYIAEGDAALEAGVARYEPALALYAAEDGLALIRRLVEQLAASSWQPRVVLLEFGYQQGTAVAELLRQHFPNGRVALHTDLAGYQRFAELDLR